MSTADEWDEPVAPSRPGVPAGDDGTGSTARSGPAAAPARLPSAADMEVDRRRRQVQIQKKRAHPMTSILGGIGLIVLGVGGSILLYVSSGWISGYLIAAPVVGLVMLGSGLIGLFQRRE